MNSKPNARRLLWWLLNPRTIVFAICLVNFIVSLIDVVQIDRQMRAYAYVEHWYPARVMVEPFLLLAAGIALLSTQWWSLLLAGLASARVIYTLGYLSWTAIHYAHDVPMLSWQAMEKLWYVIYQHRPQYLFEVVLAMVVFIYAVALLVRVMSSRPSVPAPRDNNSLHRSAG